MNESPPKKSKRWRESKTLKLGVITTLISVLGLVAGEEWIQAYPAVVSIIGMVAGFLMVIVRFYTSQPLKGRKPVEPEQRFGP